MNYNSNNNNNSRINSKDTDDNFNIYLSSFLNNRSNKKRSKMYSKNNKKSDKISSLLTILFALRRPAQFGPQWSPTAADLEYERQKRLNAHVPYYREDKVSVIKKALIMGVATKLGVQGPDSLERICLADYYSNLQDQFDTVKDKVKCINGVPIYKISISSLYIFNFNKIKAFGMGCIAVNDIVYATCVTVILERFCWKIKNIEIVPSGNYNQNNINKLKLTPKKPDDLDQSCNGTTVTL
ncbi:MAG: hypothetical protein LBT99_01845 [Bifidobacteriaceae bacterium]|jgi:hypothetical protein|nr:hypothetical protein [Bifidobacteriaceae bacterium]